MSDPMPLPIEAVLVRVADQRNQALDENAKLRVALELVTAERDQALAELEQLRAAQPMPDGSDAG